MLFESRARCNSKCHFRAALPRRSTKWKSRRRWLCWLLQFCEVPLPAKIDLLRPGGRWVSSEIISSCQSYLSTQLKTLEQLWKRYDIAFFSEYSVILVCDATGATIDVRCDYSKTVGTTYTEQASSHMSISQSVSEEITVVRDRNWLVHKTTTFRISFLGRIVQPVQYGPRGVICNRTRLDLHFRRDNELGRNDSSLSYCPCRENPLYWTGIILFTTIHHSINHPRPPF